MNFEPRYLRNAEVAGSSVEFAGKIAISGGRILSETLSVLSRVLSVFRERVRGASYHRIESRFVLQLTFVMHADFASSAAKRASRLLVQNVQQSCAPTLGSVVTRGTDRCDKSVESVHGGENTSGRGKSSNFKETLYPETLA